MSSSSRLPAIEAASRTRSPQTKRLPSSAVTTSKVLAYACSGTPADCVFLGSTELGLRPPELVVSGINHGPNLADDVNYSGTVAGAVEACLLEIPGLRYRLHPTMKRRLTGDTGRARPRSSIAAFATSSND